MAGESCEYQSRSSWFALRMGQEAMGSLPMVQPCLLLGRTFMDYERYGEGRE